MQVLAQKAADGMCNGTDVTVEVFVCKSPHSFSSLVSSSSSFTSIREIISGGYPEMPDLSFCRPPDYSTFRRTWCRQLLHDPRASGTA